MQLQTDGVSCLRQFLAINYLCPRLNAAVVGLQEDTFSWIPGTRGYGADAVQADVFRERQFGDEWLVRT
jgi:hypothetical protein